MPKAGDTRPAIERFDEKVDRSGECHVWTAATQAEGYGSFWGGRTNAAGAPIMERAHRWIWAYTHGPIPEGALVLHSCDNPPCVRLDHLRLGSPGDNMTDKVERGRHLAGEAAPGAKLTQADVDAIRAIEGRSQQSIADEFGISQKAVSNILNRRSWA